MSNFRDRFETEVERIGGVSSVSRDLGVARNTIYNWMAKGNVPLNHLMALSGVMGMDLIYVITGQPSKVESEYGEQQGLEDRRPSTGAVDPDRMEKIVDMLTDVAKQAGRRWPAKKLIRTAIEVYNYLQEEKDQDINDQKIERVLKLVVNQ